MIQQKLIDKFGGVINHMSCIYLREGEKHLRSFLQELAPLDTVIEIGTYQGVSAAVISEYAKRVYTFDVVDLPLRQQIWDFLGVKNVHFCGNGSNKKDIDKIMKAEKVDLCFIDGEHFDGQLRKDYDLCKQCERILIHDYAMSFPEVFNFVGRLEGCQKDARDTFVLLTLDKGVKIMDSKPTTPKPKKRGRAKKKRSTSTKA